MIVKHSTALIRAVLKIAPAITVSCGIFVGIVIWQSLYGYSPQPVVVTDREAKAFVDDYGTTVTYHRVVKNLIDISDEQTRTIRCGDETSYDLPVVRRDNAAAGTEAVTNRFRLPFRIKPGLECVMYTTTKYQPPFSMRPHSYPVPPLSFKVELAR